MQLLPILPTLEANKVFADHPDCRETLLMSVEYYQRIGYRPPWIGYYAQKADQLVGSGGFKGAPVNGQVEIAYGTFERFRSQGVGTEICRALVGLALQTDPAVVITARTLPEENHSARILRKNGFALLGTVEDPEDGPVWEWRYLGE